MQCCGISRFWKVQANVEQAAEMVSPIKDSRDYKPIASDEVTINGTAKAQLKEVTLAFSPRDMEWALLTPLSDERIFVIPLTMRASKSDDSITYAVEIDHNKVIVEMPLQLHDQTIKDSVEI